MKWSALFFGLHLVTALYVKLIEVTEINGKTRTIEFSVQTTEGHFEMQH